MPLLAYRANDEPERAMSVPHEEEGPCRIVLGPQDDFFGEDSISLLLNSVMPGQSGDIPRSPQ